MQGYIKSIILHIYTNLFFPNLFVANQEMQTQKYNRVESSNSKYDNKQN